MWACSDGWSLCAGPHGKDFTDFIQGEPEGLSLANETEAMEVLIAVDSIPRRLSLWRGKQPLALIEPHLLDINPGVLREFANLHTDHLKPYTRV